MARPEELTTPLNSLGAKLFVVFAGRGQGSNFCLKNGAIVSLPPTCRSLDSYGRHSTLASLLREIYPSRRKPLILQCLFPSPLCTAAAAVSRSGLPEEAAPAPCQKEEPPPGDPPSPWTPPGCAVSSTPWTMGP